MTSRTVTTIDEAAQTDLRRRGRIIVVEVGVGLLGGHPSILEEVAIVMAIVDLERMLKKELYGVMRMPFDFEGFKNCILIAPTSARFTRLSSVILLLRRNCCSEYIYRYIEFANPGTCRIVQTSKTPSSLAMNS